MKFSNYHTHCTFCDGKGEPEDYVKKAVSLDFHSLGFSSHSPTPISRNWEIREEHLNKYVETIKSLKEKYKNEIQIYCGLEIDYIPGIITPDSPMFDKLNLDYKIGSVHFVKNKNTGGYLPVDGSKEQYKEIIEDFFKGDVEAFTSEYYGLIRDMVSKHKFDILGHFDLIRKNNKDGIYFTEKEDWYKKQVFKTLEAVKNSGVILEVNTGGIGRKYLDTPYPSFWVLKKCRELNIPITLDSDAHSPENIDTYFKESLDLIKSAGYKEIYKINNHKWQPYSL